MRRWFVPQNYIGLALQLGIALAVYGFELLWAVWTRKAWQVGGLLDDRTANQAAIGIIETYQQEEA
jgi:hypothetical protein